MKAWRNEAAIALKEAFTEKHKGLTPQRGYARSVARIVARGAKSKGIPSALFYQLLVHAGWAHVIKDQPNEIHVPIASDLESRALYSPIGHDETHDEFGDPIADPIDLMVGLAIPPYHPDPDHPIFS